MIKLTKVSDIYNKLNEIAPFNTQLGFDNSGLLVGDMDSKVTKIAIALDATPYTVNKSAEQGCDLLITHHPIIFGALKSLSSNDAAFHAIKCGVSVISAHTNLDAAVDGVNDCLSNVIGLTNVAPLSNGDDIVPLARIGFMKSDRIMSTVDFAEFLKEYIDCSAVKLTQSDNNIIKSVAVCGGSGGDYITAAKNAGADALITGECKHHERLLAAQIGLNLFECGHYCTEQFVKIQIYKEINRIFNKVIIIDEKDPAIYI